MINAIIDLRNRIHSGKFRFVLTPEHWKISYVPENVEDAHVATVTKDGQLKGYAAFYLVNLEQMRTYDIREICAEDGETLAQLTDQILSKGIEDDVDFIFLKWFEDANEEVLTKRHFLSFSEAVIMAVLLNPEELLSALSDKIEDGKVLQLLLKGFEPIALRVGKTGIMVTKDEEPEWAISTDSKTFLRILFGRTSFRNEFLRGRVTVNSILNWTSANHFFNLIRQSKWHLPMGDWV